MFHCPEIRVVLNALLPHHSNHLFAPCQSEKKQLLHSLWDKQSSLASTAPLKVIFPKRLITVIKEILILTPYLVSPNNKDHSRDTKTGTRSEQDGGIWTLQRRGPPARFTTKHLRAQRWAASADGNQYVTAPALAFSLVSHVPINMVKVSLAPKPTGRPEDQLGTLVLTQIGEQEIITTVAISLWSVGSLLS